MDFEISDVVTSNIYVNCQKWHDVNASTQCTELLVCMHLPRSSRPCPEERERIESTRKLIEKQSK